MRTCRWTCTQIHRLVKELKAISSRQLRDLALLKSRLPMLMTNSYFVCTVGDAPLEVIRRHIKNQQHV